MLDKIESVLDKYVRPQLSEHLGDVKVLGFEDNILKIRLLGQCSNCPSSKFTVEEIIEKEIIDRLPEVDKVVLIEGVSDELLDLARGILNKEMKM